MPYRTQQGQERVWIPGADPLQLHDCGQANSGGIESPSKFRANANAEPNSEKDNDVLGEFISNLTGLLGKLNTEIKHFRDSEGDRSGYDSVVREYENYIDGGSHGIDTNDELIIEPVFSGGYITDVRIVANAQVFGEDDVNNPSSSSSSSSINSVLSFFESGKK